MMRNVLDELKSLKEDNYKEFNKKIIPTNQIVLGVRIPVLRKLAKQLIKQEAAISFLEVDKQNIYEMIMLEGMILSYLDKTFNELLPLTERFLDKVDNWAQIDSTICNFKNIQREKEVVLSSVKLWLGSEKEFFVRAGLVSLLAHYVEKSYLETVFELSQAVSHKGYYVHMANAWLISVCMAKYPVETIGFFNDSTLDKKTHNKAIQKSRESYRVSKEHKLMINEFKRK